MNLIFASRRPVCSAVRHSWDDGTSWKPQQLPDSGKDQSRFVHTVPGVLLLLILLLVLFVFTSWTQKLLPLSFPSLLAASQRAVGEVIMETLFVRRWFPLHPSYQIPCSSDKSKLKHNKLVFTNYILHTPQSPPELLNSSVFRGHLTFVCMAIHDLSCILHPQRRSLQCGTAQQHGRP